LLDWFMEIGVQLLSLYTLIFDICHSIWLAAHISFSVWQ
jgi:hypothetical protein